jgi:hypothetical protein
MYLPYIFIFLYYYQVPKSPTLHDLFALKSNTTSLIVIVLLVGTTPSVVALISSQEDAVTALPLPICEKYFLVVEAFPANLKGSPAARAIIISPNVVIGLLILLLNIFQSVADINPL